jgi:hypothetical protein
MPPHKSAVPSPLAVSKSDADAVLKVTHVSMFVEPSVGRGAKLILRSEVIARSKILLRAAGCPCSLARIMPVPYSAFCQWFIFVISELDKAEPSQPARPMTPDRVASSGPEQQVFKTDQCSLAELLNVFGVRLKYKPLSQLVTKMRLTARFFGCRLCACAQLR